MAGSRNVHKIVGLLLFIRTHTFRLFRFISGGFKHPVLPLVLRKYGTRDQHVFFGYYDISPVNFDDSIMLSIRTVVKDSSKQNGAPLDIGYYHINKLHNRFVSVSETMTWNWQQGCRLQWYPLNAHGKNSLIIYNCFVDNRYGCCIQNIMDGKKVKEYHMPIYAMSPDGRFGLSLNFSRMGRLRPGYGYTGLPDETAKQLVPKEDGIWRMEMESGKAELLFSIADIVQFEPLETMDGSEHYFNHICVNPDGTRFLFFHIWLQKDMRYTRLITCNPDGSDLYALINEGHVSHYTWKSVNEILCFSTHADTGMKYHLYKDRSEWKEVVGEGVLNEDGHPSLSPDRKYLLTDTYPDRYGDQKLLIYNLGSGALKEVGSFFRPFSYRGELRCDLHPRWSPSGQSIAFDSAHQGKRGIFLVSF